MSEQASSSLPEGLSSGLSSLLSDPDTLKKAAAILPDILPLLSGIMSSSGGEKEDTEARGESKTEEEKVPEPSIPATVLPKAKEDARPDSLALINALKPYLSPERRKKLDRIYGMTRMLEAMGTSFTGDGS
ncbi:MAG: hypothetical protein IKV54_03745 [Clostridia bacterium]|nr:hypothetical protein [Clostridia bacterium]